MSCQIQTTENVLQCEESSIKDILANLDSTEIPRPYECPLCKKAFYRIEHRARHIRIHTGEKPFKCDFANCTKSFSRSDELIRHQKTHANPKKRGRKSKKQLALEAEMSKHTESTDIHNQCEVKDEGSSPMKKPRVCEDLKSSTPSSVSSCTSESEDEPISTPILKCQNLNSVPEFTLSERKPDVQLPSFYELMKIISAERVLPFPIRDHMFASTNNPSFDR
ncbi:hypothetical protein K7432_006304 [Basidiobolus ranarum]|uniref:C2H2-type domain-containing protein n=1 Tax=Basidiobolus ranarum TaxID=34480 RepID=A0ABR2W1U4_9FUNG